MSIDSDIIVKAGLAIDIIGAFFIFTDFLGLPLIREINNNSKRMVGEFASLRKIYSYSRHYSAKNSDLPASFLQSIVKTISFVIAAISVASLFLSGIIISKILKPEILQYEKMIDVANSPYSHWFWKLLILLIPLLAVAVIFSLSRRPENYSIKELWELYVGCLSRKITFVFYFLNFLVLATMILMVRPGFYLKRKLNIVALKVFPATGSLLLIFGFILQLIGTFY